MLAIDRRIFNIPLEERLQARTSDLEAWNKTVLPTIRLSITKAQNQILTGHRVIRTFFSDKAAPVRNMNATLATATATIDTTNPDRIVPRRTDLRQRQRPKQKRNQPTTAPTNSRRSSYGDIRHYTSGATFTVATSQAMQTATEASIDNDDTDSSDDTDDRDDEFNVASNLSRVARLDPVKLVQKLVQKCIIQSPKSGKSCFDWLGLDIESAIVFDALPEHVSFLARPIDSVTIPSPPSLPPL
jgi:hypothetical protein